MGFVVFIFQFLPKSIYSFLLGKIFRIKFPRAINWLFFRVFVRITRIDLTEADKKLLEYKTIEEIFSRRLKSGSRSIASPICSPVDGFLGYSQSPTGILGFQAKGYYYSLRELIYGIGKIEFNFEPAWYMNFYLAPHNYHRVHCPISGELEAVRWIKGELWPVQEGFRNAVTRLYVRNERKVFRIKQRGNSGRIFLVMVGALGVGNIVVTAGTEKKGKGVTVFDPPLQLEAGDELGYFTLGSTVILIFDRTAAHEYNFITTWQDIPITMGTSLLKK